MDDLKEISSSKCFEGKVKIYEHVSVALDCKIKFAVYLPPQVTSANVPAIYVLSGLTCTEENFITKAGAFRAAAKHGVMLICPDTSPRGVPIEGDSTSWDFGQGAGFYVNATVEPWSKHYNMFDYVTIELPHLIESSGQFPVDVSAKSIMGHSMGGHGALISALKNPGMYKTASAFAPICHPINCSWGKKAFSGYLGVEGPDWEEYDATCLVAKYDGPPLEILIDQGTADSFYKDKQLLPEDFVIACAAHGLVQVALRKHHDYDHGYYFISTFIDDHIAHHARCLKQTV